VRDPTAAQWAFSLFKNVAVGHRASMQFRVEMFNAFNTPTQSAYFRQTPLVDVDTVPSLKQYSGF
jgi:hypothetical protein